MLSKTAHQGSIILVALVIMSLLIGIRVTTVAATPFSSPLPENQIHQPFVANDTGAPASQPVRVESQGIPVMWIVLLILLLFIPAAALMAARRR